MVSIYHFKKFSCFIILTFAIKLSKNIFLGVYFISVTDCTGPLASRIMASESSRLKVEIWLDPVEGYFSEVIYLSIAEALSLFESIKVEASWNLVDQQ